MDGTSGFAATVVSGATDLASKVVGSTQGFASAAQTIVDTITTRKKAPILLMHGAIQGGWVWELPRISNGAPLVSHPRLAHPWGYLPSISQILCATRHGNHERHSAWLGCPSMRFPVRHNQAAPQKLRQDMYPASMIKPGVQVHLQQFRLKLAVACRV